VSLVENMERAPLHPLDQFRAFQAMRDKGMTEEAIAAAFFVSVTVVKQRLRLTSVSPTLLEIYAEDGMTLEQLMAFTVSPTMPVRSRSGTRSRIAGRRSPTTSGGC
jgi:ParB family chromosome partitioning protein